MQAAYIYDINNKGQKNFDKYKCDLARLIIGNEFFHGRHE